MPTCGGLRADVNREIVADRGMDVEAQVLEAIKDLAGKQSKLIGEVTAAFIEQYGREYDRPITSGSGTSSDAS